MQLSYRGVSYENEPLILEMKEGEIGGKYRGQNWTYRYPRHIPQLQPKLYLQYRGVGYSTRPILGTDRLSLSQTQFLKETCSVPLKKPSKVLTNETTKTHIENMRRNLERRLEVAKASGDEDLVNLLEKESQHLSLNF